MRNTRSLHKSRRNFRSVMGIIGACTLVGIIYEPMTTGILTLSGPLVGVAIGIPLALFEVILPMNFMRGWPFAAAVLTKAFVYLALIWFVFMGSTFIYGYFHGLTLRDFAEEIWSSSTVMKVSVAGFAFITIIFFRQLNHLLGPGNLVRYLFGRYHRPRKEERIFMFLDMKDSTTIAERLDMDAYYKLLNDFFHDIAEPILATKADIYQYIGDEVVLTWPMKTGLKDANCIRIFSEIDKSIRQHASYYMAHYGLIPEYKAGVYGGEVIRAEIGDLKRELIYNGDVLNTTARIQAECNRFNARLLTSASMIKQITLPPGFKAEEIGDVLLKGKRQPLRLVRLTTEPNTPLFPHKFFQKHHS